MRGRESEESVKEEKKREGAKGRKEEENGK